MSFLARPQYIIYIENCFTSSNLIFTVILFSFWLQKKQAVNGAQVSLFILLYFTVWCEISLRCNQHDLNGGYKAPFMLNFNFNFTLIDWEKVAPPTLLSAKQDKIETSVIEA
jgi:Mn2+/Fe2+ NRAMP family transporter